jgi:hypothetical protein
MIQNQPSGRPDDRSGRPDDRSGRPDDRSGRPDDQKFTLNIIPRIFYILFHF